MERDVVIIGGGAAGVMAAISAKRADRTLSVLLLEKNGRLLKKLIATGNGRCNYTNIQADTSNFYGNDPSFVSYALSSKGPYQMIDFFEELGILPRFEKAGKVYPMSLQASSVSDMLRFELDRLDVEIMTDFEMKDLVKNGDAFIVKGEKDIHAKKVVITSGGAASPDLGGSKSAYEMMQRLGHGLAPISPVLVQVKTEKSIIYGMQGIKMDADVTFKTQGKVLESYEDELLFTEYGLSGPVIFYLSKFCHMFNDLTAQIDFIPRYSTDDLVIVLDKRKHNLQHLTMENFLNGMIHKKLGQALIKYSGIEKLSQPVSLLSMRQIDEIARCLKGFEVKITGTTGFKNAQATGGGVLTGQFDDKTMESKIVKGLYAAGELLDIFGDCGGYNLQWAWCSGAIAGISAACT